ncbi:hypothetical protein K469DRAFT_683468 [Zopfia rhizophila CBS 207.26]|uniref:Uncharacterized protein n=1 Tax=Zopfia rhizophila CBS 207.26 TaxID=1314779 RepID=A0A6A6DCU5_9PEZI|nr:hypothetical protein K469DRAFT_683468 [Zopfia rhizophila CBS 207.26]
MGVQQFVVYGAKFVLFAPYLAGPVNHCSVESSGAQFLHSRVSSGTVRAISRCTDEICTVLYGEESHVFDHNGLSPKGNTLHRASIATSLRTRIERRGSSLPDSYPQIKPPTPSCAADFNLVSNPVAVLLAVARWHFRTRSSTPGIPCQTVVLTFDHPPDQSRNSVASFIAGDMLYKLGNRGLSHAAFKQISICSLDEAQSSGDLGSGNILDHHSSSIGFPHWDQPNWESRDNGTGTQRRDENENAKVVTLVILRMSLNTLQDSPLKGSSPPELTGKVGEEFSSHALHNGCTNARRQHGVDTGPPSINRYGLATPINYTLTAKQNRANGAQQKQRPVSGTNGRATDHVESRCVGLEHVRPGPNAIALPRFTIKFPSSIHMMDVKVSSY